MFYRQLRAILLLFELFMLYNQTNSVREAPPVIQDFTDFKLTAGRKLASQLPVGRFGNSTLIFTFFMYIIYYAQTNKADIIFSP